MAHSSDKLELITMMSREGLGLMGARGDQGNALGKPIFIGIHVKSITYRMKGGYTVGETKALQSVLSFFSFCALQV